MFSFQYRFNYVMYMQYACNMYRFSLTWDKVGLAVREEKCPSVVNRHGFCFTFVPWGCIDDLLNDKSSVWQSTQIMQQRA